MTLKKDLNFNRGEPEWIDPVSDKYPLNTPAQVRAAWNYIHEAANAARYTVDECERIKQHIQQMAYRLGVRLNKHEQ